MIAVMRRFMYKRISLKKTWFHEYVFRYIARYIRTAEVPIIIKNVL